MFNIKLKWKLKYQIIDKYLSDKKTKIKQRKQQIVFFLIHRDNKQFTSTFLFTYHINSQ